ncbi:helix-turn-helix transcriptional regulator [Paenalkalicoccus suaedae]|uniref:Helix-turn-helix transcriptional regulator n=2 Tax=Paenalkalicoccus suaedae TaxID=2592382 RepID=A0A859FKE7_9BACI|nr:helix-turn-helix transcriptional regulator [Paenalkalicoccus suaedae]QKS73272.1 helix-turn-helix transcriptional regulator [Paenalkalicoccus suaedae]
MRVKLRRKRIESGHKNVRNFVKGIGISESYYYKIEQGIRTPDIELGKKIADKLDSTVDDIFFDDDLDETSRLKQEAI